MQWGGKAATSADMLDDFGLEGQLAMHIVPGIDSQAAIRALSVVSLAQSFFLGDRPRSYHL